MTRAALNDLLAACPDLAALDARAAALEGASANRKGRGQFFTPPTLAAHLAEAAARGLPPDRGGRALDPACGDGRLLCALAARRPALEVYGVDADPAAVLLAQARLVRQLRLSPEEATRRIRHADAIGLLGGATPPLDWAAWRREIGAEVGFDVVIGNPPWVAYAGRARAPLSEAARAEARGRFAAFAGYPSLHGLFVELAAGLLAPGGRLALLLPAAVAELRGYAPTRAAHDARCQPDPELPDHGDGRFEGVVQPCVSLLSTRVEGGRAEAGPGAPWVLARPDLAAADQALLARLAALAPLPPTCFGDRGLQTDRLTRAWLAPRPPGGAPGRPLRCGGDIGAFTLAPPSFVLRPEAPSALLGPPQRWEAIAILVRQTARFPIAAASDGLPFRNSLLAGFASEAWPAPLLLALLNSALVRWHHFHRFRDARQAALPQVKVAHLRAIPAPAALTPELREALIRLAGAPEPDRAALDALVGAAFGLSPAEQARVSAWHAALSPPSGRGRRTTSRNPTR